MIRKPLLAMVAVASLVGCSVVPGTAVTNKAISTRSVASVSSKVQPPTLAAMRQILPAKIPASEARGKMILPTRNQLRVPQTRTRQTKFWGSFGLWNYGSFGLWPYSYLGSSWYAPYYLMGGSWYPFAFSSYAYGLYSYLAYPFAYDLGCYSPYIYGLGAYGLPYGGLGYYPYAWPYSYSLYGWGYPSWIL